MPLTFKKYFLWHFLETFVHDIIPILSFLFRQNPEEKINMILKQKTREIATFASCDICHVKFSTGEQVKNHILYHQSDCPLRIYVADSHRRPHLQSCTFCHYFCIDGPFYRAKNEVIEGNCFSFAYSSI